MAYLCNTSAERQRMLESLGLQSLEQLFEQIPEPLRLTQPLNLPPALSELELEAHVRRLAARNHGQTERVCFLGGGAYDHFVPAVVDEVAARGEYYTAYTPYQPEASQGSLQAFFEYQTLVCQLTGLEVSNASLYEAASSVAEAVLMAMRVTRRRQKVVLLGTVHPEYFEVVTTYVANIGCTVDVVPTPDGTADPDEVARHLDEQTACLVIQHPNFLGCLEPAERLVEAAHAVGALAVVVFDPISLGLLKRPGDYGADIAVAEGQSLGIPLQFGGPYLGILACRQQLVRQMPGRLIGETVDRNGRRCYVLNLQAREQHIRREKATSNICTNQGLMALRATVYLSLLGPSGLRKVAELCCQKAHYAAERLSELEGCRLLFDRPFFKEFVLGCSDPQRAAERARRAGFDVGPRLSRFSRWVERSGVQGDGLLVAVTEKRTRDEIDRLAQVLADA